MSNSTEAASRALRSAPWAPLGAQTARRAVKRSSAIADEIRSWIISRRLRPGDSLPVEKKMIEHFSASRATMREALKELEVQGLVRVKSGPNGGPIVEGNGSSQAMLAMQNFCYFENVTVEDLYQLRTTLEVMLVRSVAGKLDEAGLDALDRSVAVSEHGAGNQEARRLQRESEFAFHSILARAAPNRLLGLMIEVIVGILANATTRHSAEHALHSHWSESNCQYHRALLSALRDGDGDRAADLMQEHMEDAHRALKRLYTEFSLDDIALSRRAGG